MKVPHESAGAITSVLAATALFLTAPTWGNGGVTNTPAGLTTKGKTVHSDTTSPSIPPHVARYLNGPASDDQQFAFLIGNWDVNATTAAYAARQCHIRPR